VSRSFDLLTDNAVYRIQGIPVARRAKMVKPNPAVTRELERKMGKRKRLKARRRNNIL
jgi:hypothetical protein